MQKKRTCTIDGPIYEGFISGIISLLADRWAYIREGLYLEGSISGGFISGDLYPGGLLSGRAYIRRVYIRGAYIRGFNVIYGM